MEASSYTSIDEYISQFEPEIQTMLTSVRQVIKDAAPEATERISYQMPAFYLHGNLVYFAAHKKHIGFYPCADGIEHFKEEFGDCKFSKGAVQFPMNQPMPYELIRRIVEYRVGQNKRLAEEKAMKKKR